MHVSILYYFFIIWKILVKQRSEPAIFIMRFFLCCDHSSSTIMFLGMNNDHKNMKNIGDHRFIYAGRTTLLKPQLKTAP